MKLGPQINRIFLVLPANGIAAHLQHNNYKASHAIKNYTLKVIWLQPMQVNLRAMYLIPVLCKKHTQITHI